MNNKTNIEEDVNKQEKIYTFFRDDTQEKLLRRYNFCQRPADTNMSLRRFTDNGEIEGYMSESLAEHFGLIQVDLNEFIWKFVQPIIKENLCLKADRERLKEENKEMNTKILSNAGIYQLGYKDGQKENQAKANKYDALVEQIKKTIKVLEMEYNYDYMETTKTIETLQELIPKEE